MIPPVASFMAGSVAIASMLSTAVAALALLTITGCSEDCLKRAPNGECLVICTIRRNGSCVHSCTKGLPCD